MLITSALTVFVLWGVMAIALIGIGSTVLRPFQSSHSLGDAFWTGLALSVALLEIWSLVLPVNSAAAISLFALGLLGLPFNRSFVRARMQREWDVNRHVILPGVAITAFLALRACSPCDYYDTGLYGAQAVRWIMTYPAVPGLANLHGRLGFNSSAFLCVAVLNTSAGKDLGIRLFPGFMMAAIFITIVPSCVRLIRSSPLMPADWFRGILVIPVVFWATRSKIVGTLTDEPATIACLVAASILFETLCFQREDIRLIQTGPQYERMIVAMTLLASAVAFKLSTIVFALLAWCVAFFWIWRSAPAQKQARPLLTGALMLSALILLPWCIRGIMSSGYPVFPASAVRVPADWRLPAPVTKVYAEAVRSWGRNPDAVSVAETQGSGWLMGWLRRAIRDRVSLQVPLAISLGGLGTALGLRFRKKRVPACPWLWLLLPSLAGVAFWFWASPDPRFGQFSIWTMAGALGTWAILALTGEQRGARLGNTQGGVPSRQGQNARVGQSQDYRARLALKTQRLRVGLAAGAILALAAWCLAGYGWREPYRRLLAEGGLKPLPKANVTARKTLSGLIVYVPAVGNQCWDAPLPCTPYFDETLRLRNGKSMRSGFASEGKPDFGPEF